MSKNLIDRELMASVTGALVRRIRMDVGLNMNQLARILGKSAKYVSDIENGVRNLDVDELIGISAALGQEPREMLRRLMVDYGAAKKLRSEQNGGIGAI